MPKKNNYFPNKHVEDLLKRYQDGGCTDIALRDEIMGHLYLIGAHVIKRYTIWKLYQYPTYDSAREFCVDLEHQCYVKMEGLLWKWDRNRKTKLFSMMTQICILFMLQEAERWNRHFQKRKRMTEVLLKQRASKLATTTFVERFWKELEDVEPEEPFLKLIHPAMVDALKVVMYYEYSGVVKALTKKTGLPRHIVNRWLEWLKSKREAFSLFEVPPEEVRLYQDEDDQGSSYT